MCSIVLIISRTFYWLVDEQFDFELNNCIFLFRHQLGSPKDVPEAGGSIPRPNPQLQ